MTMMAFYGKGGIGKSTTVANLSLLFARQGLRVLQFGCDPKSDSCLSLAPGLPTTVMDEWMERGESNLRAEHCLISGRCGVACIEAGGPTPGSGCGGRAITKAFELVGSAQTLRRDYDVVLFDVLGDVVCGGFSAPMRQGYADQVFIVTSGELRSLYAANNICHAVAKCAGNGARLAGLVGNLRGLASERERIARFAAAIGTTLLVAIPRDDRVGEAEAKKLTVVEYDPESPAGRSFQELHAVIDNLRPDDLTIPRPLARPEFDRFQ